jgi:hypothetical protein
MFRNMKGGSAMSNDGLVVMLLRWNGEATFGGNATTGSGG